MIAALLGSRLARAIAMGAAFLAVVAFLSGQNQKLRIERDAYKERLEAIAGAREIENVANQIDDCGLIGLLIGGGDVRSTDWGAVLGCAEGAPEPETENGRVSGAQ
mgnify:CR=1 FL=1